MHMTNNLVYLTGGRYDGNLLQGSREHYAIYLDDEVSPRDLATDVDKLWAMHFHQQGAATSIAANKYSLVADVHCAALSSRSGRLSKGRFNETMVSAAFMAAMFTSRDKLWMLLFNNGPLPNWPVLLLLVLW